jgi:hypothetical protein
MLGSVGSRIPRTAVERRRIADERWEVASILRPAEYREVTRNRGNSLLRA